MRSGGGRSENVKEKREVGGQVVYSCSSELASFSVGDDGERR